MAQRQAVGELVGRRHELSVVAGVVEQAAKGHGSTVVVEGEAGIGKTRLVDEVLAGVEGMGVDVLRASADELERRRPFGLVADCLRVRDGDDKSRLDIARLLHAEVVAPRSAIPEPVPGREFAVVDAMVALVEEASARTPVAVVLEDLQWADSLSLLVLNRLDRIVPELAVAVILTVRPLPRTEELDSLLRGLGTRGATTLQLGPLEHEEVGALAHDLLGSPPGPELRRRLNGAGGNPLFVVELVRAADGSAPDPLPSLPMTILNRLRVLPSEAVEMLRVASVLGSGFTAAELAAVTDKRSAALVEPIRACLQAGVLAPAGERFTFRHDVIREALYEDLPESLRAALHTDAARVLGASGAPVVRVAEHLMRGAVEGDEQAVSWLHNAAREVAVTSPAVAAELLGRALELARPGAQVTHRLMADRIVNLTWAGRVSDAESLARQVIESSPEPSLGASLRLHMAQGLAVQGRAAEALAHLDWAASSPDLPAADRAMARAWAAHARWASGDVAGAVATAEAARELGEEVGADTAQSVALAALAMIAYLRGSHGEAVVLAGEAVRRSGDAGGPESQGFQLHVIEGTCLLDEDRFEEAAESLRRGRQVSRDAGSAWKLGLYDMVDGLRLFWTGKWDDAIAHLEAGVRASEDMGTGHTVMARSLRALIALHRDDVAGADTWLMAAEEELAAAPAQYRADWAAWAKALVAEAKGDSGGAFEILHANWTMCAGFGLASEYPVLGPDLVRLALEAGDRGLAMEVTRAVEEVSALNPDVPSLQGAALRCRGLAEQSTERLVQSVAAYRRGNRAFQGALAAEDAAAALACTGRADDARRLFEEACVVYEALSATRPLARAEARLRTLGVRRGRRGSRKRPATGWASLTDTERAVVALMVQGLSNPEIGDRMFVSRRTVQTHVSHILAKLGLTSRTEVAAHAARLDRSG